MILSTVADLNQLLITYEEKSTFLFDMDGTFINTENIHSIACRSILAELDPSLNLPHAHWFETEFTGLPDSRVYELLIQKSMLSSHISLEQFLEEKSESFIKELGKVELDKILKHEIKNFIQRAKDDDFIVGLVTASERKVTHAILNRFDLFKLFDIVVTRDDTPVTKPDPTPYIYAMEKLNVTPDDCVIFEDSIAGLSSAKAAKGTVIQVSWYQ